MKIKTKYMRYWKWKMAIKLLVLSLIFNISNAQNINEKTKEKILKIITKKNAKRIK